MSEPNISKLPKWAQEEFESKDREIKRLARHVEDLQTAMGQGPERPRVPLVFTFDRMYGTYGNDEIILPAGRVQAVRTWSKDGTYPQLYISFAWRKDGTLDVNASATLTVRPSASNAISLVIG